MSNFGTMTLVLPSGREVELFRRLNPDGTVGGWVAKNTTVHPSAYIDISAIVGPKVVIAEQSYIGENSVVMS